MPEERPRRSPLRGLTLAVGAAVLAVAAVVTWIAGRASAPREVVVPDLSADGESGRQVFGRSCASCHGAHGQGTASGPPLVHMIYRPAHHADQAFELAVRQGVRAHHWRFGDMPPQPLLSPAEVGQVTRYVRELQRANGIE